MRKPLRFFIYSFVIFSFPCLLYAQKDTLFWFVAPEATSAHGDAPIYFRLSSFGGSADVTIDQPANPGFTPISVTIPPNSSQTVDLTAFLATTENAPPDQVLNYGYRIRSTAIISAYYEVFTSCQCNPEIYALKGKNALGTEFRIPFNDVWANGSYSPPALSAIDIVATEDNTQVTILPSKDVVGHPAGVPYTITLNKGQTYSAAAAGTGAADQLGGSIVTSNKPIAVTIKDDSMSFQGCRDLCGDQLIPLPLIGREYVVVRGSLNVTDRVWILATQNNTQVSINGTAVATLNANQSYMHQLTSPAVSCYILTNNPVYVLHYTGFGCELGSAIVPPVKCTGTQEVSVTRSTSEYFGLMLFTQAGNESSFLLNGNAGLITASQFSPVPGTGGAWVAALIPFGTTEVPVGTPSVVANTSGLFHMGIVNGGASSGCRYGFFSDFSGVSFNLNADQTVSCPGADDGQASVVVLGGVPPYSYQWSTGDTTSIVSGLPTGTYTVVVSDAAGCSDSLSIQIPEPPPMAFITQTIQNVTCHGGSDGAVFTSPGGGTQPYTIIWNTGAQTQNLQNLTAGTYTAIFTDANNCDTLTLSATVTEPPPINPVATASPAQICYGSTATLQANGNFSVQWSPSTGLSSTSGNSVTAQPDQTTTYTATVTDSAGCQESAAVTVNVFHFLADLDTVQANPQCFGKVQFNALLKFPNRLASADWQFGDGNSGSGIPTEHMYQLDGIVNVTVTFTDTLGCDTTVTLAVQVKANSTQTLTNIPNILTPDGDNLNDVLKLNPDFVECNPFTLTIFNRWGNIVFESRNNDPPFEGKNQQGQWLSPGVYFYYLKSEKQELSGHISIVRP
ncbi:MAG: gliding motility-associated C-terminal domain-containing protein [Flavobacteriales bacterium]|nr:gliding motility-associated C-terminal domain-containing protein [Flavobacteriales bacterium]MCX7649710.1 gliding motility-associated C-terminal domain-containing protein [Flavobacteriales bacterium]MDW8432683.1 gliding motility-associated C-terminal domain-containing protein [Flavobacteriales bacterium]